MSRKLLDDCFLHDRDRLRHDEALAILRERVHPVAGIERVPLADAAGRILAGAVIATNPVPAHTNAAVDGYAFDHASYIAGRPGSMPVVGRAAAGHPFEGQPIPAGSAIRIFTGAVMPAGTDTVAMQEDTSLAEGAAPAVSIPAGLKLRANVRWAGEDVAAGSMIAAEGSVLGPQDLAALASVGLGEVACRRRLRVAIVSTGDEIVPAGGRPLAPGEVYDANAPMLRALAEQSGAFVTDLGIWPDRADVVQPRLAAAARDHDVIITSGGASRGEEDHLVHALDAIGTRHLWQLAIKPGRPMSFGQIGDTVILVLPGNPVAVFVCFLMYAVPLLGKLGGARWREPRRYKLPAAFTFENRKIGRREFWRGILRDGPEGPAVGKFERDGSGLITGLRVADGLIEIPEEVAAVRPGDSVDFIPFTEFAIVR